MSAAGAVLGLEHLEPPYLALGIDRAPLGVLGVRGRELSRLHPGLEVVLGGPAGVDEVAAVLRGRSSSKASNPAACDTLPARAANRSSKSARPSSGTVTALITTIDIRHLRSAGAGVTITPAAPAPGRSAVSVGSPAAREGHRDTQPCEAPEAHAEPERGADRRQRHRQTGPGGERRRQTPDGKLRVARLGAHGVSRRPDRRVARRHSNRTQRTGAETTSQAK